MKTAETVGILTRANTAMRQGRHTEAMCGYSEALMAMPEIAFVITPNISRLRREYQIARQGTGRLRVAVCGWELAHNAAGRAHTLAMLYERFAETELIGNVYARKGKALWEPIRETAIPKRTILIEGWAHFINQAIALVVRYPYDLVHLSKPRAPNIIYGVLYKLIWGSRILVDIDDEELAFVGADTPIGISEYLRRHSSLPGLDELAGKEWTRIAVGMIDQFDGVTVSNPALQERYGGEIIRHARDEALYQPSEEKRKKSRAKYGVPLEKKLVLFLGTPKAHKGLVETGQAIRQLARNDVLFAVVGDFPDPELKRLLQAIPGVDYLFIGNQPFEAVPEIVSMADIVILLQQTESPISYYQLPAKLGDALAMGVLVLATPTAALADVFKAGALLPASPTCLAENLSVALNNPESLRHIQKAARHYFQDFISFRHNVKVLKNQLVTSSNVRFAQTWYDLAAAIGVPVLQALTMQAKADTLASTSE